MTQTFTPFDDVVRYIYEETTTTENTEVEEALLFDQELLEFYLDSIELKQQLNRIEMQPSDQAIERILLYSQNFSSNSQPAYA